MKTIRQNIIIFVLLFFGILIFGQNVKEPKIVFAEKTPWFGGVAGVTGIHYHIKVVKNPKLKLYFKNLYAEGDLLPVTVKLEKGIYDIRANYSKTELPTLELPSDTQEKETAKKDTGQFWLEYTVGTSKTKQKLKVLKFTVNKNTPLYE